MPAYHVKVYLEKGETEEILERVRDTLSAVRLSDFLYRRVNPYMRIRTERRFENEGDDASGRWAPLRDRTNQWRQHLGFPPYHPINQRTGELKEWMTQPGIVALLGTDAAGLRLPGNAPGGTDLDKKFSRAQQGDLAEGGRTVPRPVLAANKDDQHAILIEFAHWFAESIA